ncbi:hypothetical protein GBAR_LOCUS22299 [Geodia barretti]|uniref:Uncharacterized protein n=1 Tax=Geodia barretti TaxID=519541 RepID=A0AA35T448_GEOBA|nr:hypothetical protein GBAR_LOCUS22299 [Geodia barretti]
MSIYQEEQQELISPSDETTLSTRPIAASAGGSHTASEVVPGSFRDKRSKNQNNGIREPPTQLEAQPRPLNPTLGESDYRPVITPNQQPSVEPISETTPLMSATSQLVSGENESINVNENRNVNGIRVMCGCSTKTRVIVSLLISFAALLLFTSVFGVVAKKSSSSAPAFPNDVVLVDRVSGVWYNQLTVSYEQETSAREVNEDEAQITVYYVERPEIREEIYAESSLPKNFSFPQVLIVNNSHQNYLLKHSRIQLNFSI